jgi:hypothetical protein
MHSTHHLFTCILIFSEKEKEKESKERRDGGEMVGRMQKKHFPFMVYI